MTFFESEKVIEKNESHSTTKGSVIYKIDDAFAVLTCLHVLGNWQGGRHARRPHAAGTIYRITTRAIYPATPHHHHDTPYHHPPVRAYGKGPAKFFRRINNVADFVVTMFGGPLMLICVLSVSEHVSEGVCDKCVCGVWRPSHAHMRAVGE